MRRIVSSENFARNAKKPQSLYDDFNDELEEKDLYDELTSNTTLSGMEDDDIDSEEVDDFDSDDYNDINAENDYDSITDDGDTVDYVKVKKGVDSLVNVLRDELKLKECDRGYLSFKYRGELYDGIPMVEINPGKFVFKIDDKMKSILLAEITVM